MAGVSYYALLLSDGTLLETDDAEQFIAWKHEYGPEIVDHIVHDPVLAVSMDPGHDFVVQLICSTRPQG